MGSCSPIHFRSAAAGITLLCVGLSFGSSNGLAYLLGGRTAGIHNLLPFLLIGIGVDDMFVISSNIDQTDPRLPVEKRIQIGLQHAGSSITITSFTNAIAFFLGCTSSLDALSSFCFFAGLGVLMLYLTSISVFAAYMVWDIKRQMNKKGDCCGACMCKENTMICCGGRLLTKAQKSYPFQGEEGDEIPNEKYANGTQKFLHEKLSKWTTSKYGIIVILVIWTIYTCVSIYGVS
jgi:predicted RND superfamily exporter protein